ncbi:MAG: lysine--tRNA ligase [Gammaproteobacteria bacterium]|nr:lysine--tRNA ligase [Gammaproteobacteria bacterium]
MAKYNWPHQEAKRITSRTRKKDTEIIFETGYGPSGLPHIGTFAEVARTTFVMNAFRLANPDKDFKLIAFSDDMDGLRNIPDNVPNHDVLKPHLGASLSSVPDPYQEAHSYSANMNQRLRNFLDHYGFDYEFRSSTECYKNGVFNDGLKTIMDHYDDIRNLFINTISPDKRDAWSPFFPVCDQCGKINTTTVTAVHPSSYELSYHCNKNDGEVKSCSYQGQTSILNGQAKVGWKVDWALRWHVFGVDYEMHGKDLIDSSTLSSKICSILGTKPPINYKYELFLDEQGAKISKKIGNGVSMEQWQAYAPVEALLLFLLEDPNKARRMGLALLPTLVDNYLKALRTEDQSRETSALWFINQISERTIKNLQASDVTYSLLVNVAENLHDGDAELLYDYAIKYDAGIADNEDLFRRLCEHVIRYTRDMEAAGVIPKVKPEATELFPQLLELRDALQNQYKQGEATPEILQTTVFDIAKQHELNARDWFKFLYQSLLEKNQGPRLGSLFAMLGQERVIKLFSDAVERNQVMTG